MGEEVNERAAAQCCGKDPSLCVCGEIEHLSTRIEVLILQHPQELDRELGTARLAHSILPRSTFVAGLSRRNLTATLGREVDPRRWLVLYLGSFRPPPTSHCERAQLVPLTRQGTPHPEGEKVLSEIEGIVVLDGTWSQAKALWWRNPWLLKLPRAALIPARPSLYGRLRKEPRREGLSTIESIGAALSILEGNPEIEARLREAFEVMLTRYRKVGGRRGASGGSQSPSPRRKMSRGRRRRHGSRK